MAGNGTTTHAPPLGPVAAVAAAERTAYTSERKIEETAVKIWAMITWIWAKYKLYILGGAAGLVVLVVLLIICCIRCCRRKKKKKADEKIKLKGAKPKKKLKRIQPGKTERLVMEELGTMTFTLKYDKSSQMLLIKILESENIPVHDISGYAYAFVVAKLLPLHKDEEVEHKTKHVRASFWPSYGDIISFEVEKDVLNKQVLYLYQYELNRWSKHDGIGQIAFELKDAGLLKDSKEIEYKKKLLPYDPLIGLEVETGAVFLNLDYEPTTWDLTVELKQAEIIPQNDEEKASSYVTVSLMNKDEEILEKRKSKRQKGTLQPKFDDNFKFVVPDNMLPEIQLLVKLKQPHLFKKNSLFGKTVILPTCDNWKQLLEKEFTSGWFSVYLKPKKK